MQRQSDQTQTTAWNLTKDGDRPVAGAIRYLSASEQRLMKKALRRSTQTLVPGLDPGNSKPSEETTDEMRIKETDAARELFRIAIEETWTAFEEAFQRYLADANRT